MSVLLRADSGRAPTQRREPDALGRRRKTGPLLVPYLPLRTGCIHCVVTSPPYLGLRIYGDDRGREVGDGGLGDYIDEMCRLALELRRVMDDEAVWWLNLGDTAAGSGGAGGDHNIGGSKSHITKYRPPKLPMERMQFAQVPERLMIRVQDLCVCGHDRAQHPDEHPGRTVLLAGACSFAQDCGCAGFRAAFLVRKRITWAKGRIRRGDDNFAHTRRPGASSEPIYMITKQRQHRWNSAEIKRWDSSERGDVWTFPPGQPQGDRHFAPFPDELVRRCLALTTSEDDVVLDPFMGSGTTARVAEALGRRAVGLDLYAGLPFVKG